MGNFYWKDRQKWAAQVTMPDGKRATATCSHEHPSRGRGACQEAKELLVDLERLRSQNAPSNARTLTLGAFLKGWLDDVKPNLAPATWRKHESIIRVHIAPRLQSVRLSDLSVSDARRLLQQPGLDAQSLRHVRATLRRALADAQRDGLVVRNVAALAEPPKLNRAERTVLNAEQCRSLIEGTREDRLHAFWVLAVTTGMREAEMLGLTWEDVDLGTSDSFGPTPLSVASGTRRPAAVDVRNPVDRLPHRSGGDSARVVVRQTLQRVEGQWKLMPPKTAKSRRVIPLPPVTVTALKAHRKRQMEERMAAGKPGDSGLVFTTTTGRPIHGSNLLPELRAHLTRLGLPKVGIHDLRHSCATVLFGMGVPLEVVADILGHSTTRVTTDLYRHKVERLQVEAAAKMQEAMGG